MDLPIDYDREALKAFCERWMVKEFLLFGSVLRDDFGPDSDVDVILDFREGERWSLFDLGGMQQDLEDIFGRKVDLLEKKGVETMRNWIRQRAIMESMERLDVA